METLLLYNPTRSLARAADLVASPRKQISTGQDLDWKIEGGMILSARTSSEEAVVKGCINWKDSRRATREDPS